MIQKTYFAHNIEELSKVIMQVKEAKYLESAKNVLALFYFNGLSKAKAKEYVGAFTRELPDVKVSGISVFTSREDWNENGVSISFMFFDYVDVDIFTYKTNEDNCFSLEEIIQDFSKKLGSIGDVKTVLCYPVDPHNDFTKLLEEVSTKYKEIVFFGCLAGARDYRAGEGHFYSPDDIKEYREEVSGNGHLEHLMDGSGIKNVSEAFSIGNEIINSGFVFVVLSGERLNCLARYALGWKPLGIGFSITGRAASDEMGNACITEIDGMPAVDVYSKYLDVEPDEYFLDNVCEFPIVLNRNGTLVARVPLYVGANKEIYFAGDIRSDEKIRLSYVNYFELFNMSKEAAEQIRMFKPEAIIMAICYNRFHFLKQEQHKEIEFFEDVSKDLLYGFGGYEILKGFDRGGTLNSALISLALSENEVCDCAGEIVLAHKDEDKRMKSFAERLTTFVETTTKELEDAYADAEAANQAKSDFLSHMSHEIRTPINAILGMNEMILRECDDDKIIGYANDINSASNSLLGIVNDILDFSKINAGKMEIIPVEYELASVLNDLITMVQKRAEDKGLKIKVNVDPTIPHLLYGDEIRLKQIVTNILTNAVKYTEKGGVVIVVGYEYHSEENKGDFDDDISCSLDGDIRCCGNKNLILKFSIEDTGIGIKEEDMERLFNSFERVDEERNRTIEGTGLGMSITENLLSLMGSTLKVESEYGVGSRFSFNLVQKIVDFTPIGDFEAALKRSLKNRKEYHESFVAPEAKILVVDDTPMNLTVIRNLLKKTQIQIDTAQSGFECLDMIKVTKYDIIFLDHRMPEMDGIECLHRIKEDTDGINYKTPIIALTANAVSGSREMYLDAGFDNYLTKPINTEAMETMMSTLLPVSKVRAAKHNTENSEDEKVPEWLEEIPFINIKRGVKNCGDVKSYLSAIEAYVDNFEDNKNAIIDSKDRDEIEAYTIKVHALKSSSKIIGAMEIGELAEKLEAAGNNNDIDAINVYTDELISYYSSLYYMLRHHLKTKSNASDKPEITLDSLKEAFMAMDELAQMYDYDSIVGIMDSLEEYTIPKEFVERIRALKKAISKADWDTIISLLKG